MTTYIDKMLAAYLACALWSSSDDDGNSLDGRFDTGDIATESVADARAQCADFISSVGGDLGDMDPEQAGHDFWLTRNHHGAGFWDRGLGTVGQRLTDATRPYGGSDAYVGDDGKVYLS